jgi:hypothetical protein
MPFADFRAYSKQYTTIKRIGHARPTPGFGAPTLVWHLGIWPKRVDDPQDTYGLTHQEARDRFEQKQQDWVNQINGTLRQIQERHRRSGRIEGFHLGPPDGWECDGRGDDEQEPAFKVFERESLHFTLWWKGGKSDQPEPGLSESDRSDPDRDALRVRVHAHMHEDYLTLSFYIDITKPWKEGAHFRSTTAPGAYRKRLMSAAEDVKRICEKGLDDPAIIDGELVPEKGISPAEAEQLLNAAELLYHRVWTDFCEAFDINTVKLAGSKGEIFANFLGLVLATGGPADNDTDYIKKCQANAAPGTKPFAKFDKDGAEPNAVIKAYWPFVRRTTPFADYREYIGCAMMDWRAIYISALGAEFTTDYSDETESRSDDAPSNFLPASEEETLATVRHAATAGLAPAPLKYLILTKGSPHRKQIGRVVGRVNAMGTMRLVALKDWSVIRDSDAHIRMQGQELDRVATQWSQRRKTIDDVFAADGSSRGRRWSPIPIRHSPLDNDERKYQNISDLTKEVEGELITIAAELDKIGFCAAGGLHYRISRSTYYVEEFDVLIDTLQLGNIHSWNSYNSFVRLGLQPAFDYIKEAGLRLRTLRQRLQTVTEAIQTSALVAQTTATRANTNALREIAFRNALNNIMLGILNVLFGLIALLMGASLYRGGTAMADILRRILHELIGK